MKERILASRKESLRDQLTEDQIELQAERRRLYAISDPEMPDPKQEFREQECLARIAKLSRRIQDWTRKLEDFTRPAIDPDADLLG